MPEIQFDNSPENQHLVLQNHAGTPRVCHDVVLFHRTEHKKHPEKK